ncbi:MAG: translation initiation factor IF-2 [Hyphomonadaceae bacterium]|nr:translation initiation factor IF-2 [Hyphomonadaceae bacterium]
MSDGNEQKESSGRKPLTLTRTTATGTVRQSFSHGRTKQVAVEVREKRSINRAGAGAAAAPAAPGPGVPPPLQRPTAAPKPVAAAPAAEPRRAPAGDGRNVGISDEEARRREAAIQQAMAEREAREQRQRAEDERRRALEEAQRKLQAEQEALERETDARRRAETQEEVAEPEPQPQVQARAPTAPPQQQPTPTPQRDQTDVLSELGGRVKGARKPMPVAPVKPTKKGEPKRREGRLTLDMVEREVAGDDDRVRSLAAYRRAQQKEKERRAKMMGGSAERIVREVIIPESITVQELSNRMAVRVADIIKFMMRQGQMLKQSDELDADTAELIATEHGHTVKRVAESDVEEGLAGDIVDTDENLEPRPPVVTIMGHVDHGKTSLLDALRQTDVVSGEAGGITQHIGAYQVRVASGQRVTFLDTPGHAAFSAMRARGAKVTDIVVLVVAADDGVMPQTIEAIQHAKASGVPMIVAINKMDKPDANPDRVLSELTQHEVIAEQFGGDVQIVKVSALKKQGLEDLVEQILLQAEVLNLRANPNRPAEATVIESKLDKGRGTVATVLVQNGTLKRGDIVVVGAQVGRVRAITNERGQQLQGAGPSEPVEIMGLEGVPEPGDVLNVVENENRAREVANYRARTKKQRGVGVKSATTSLESMMAKFKDSTAKELPILIKADVQGSAEAIVGSLEKLAHEEVRARVVLSGVGAINESDVQLAKGSGAPIIGFNVRASKEARDLAEREGVEIRYYNIIYDLIDDIKGVMSGMLAPLTRETFLGNAEVLEVFNISKVGKVAGCRVTDGVVRKGAKVRILRDNVVIQEMGVLTTLKRFKDEVNEVISGQECGMSFGPFQEIKQGDVIECFNVEVVQRSL